MFSINTWNLDEYSTYTYNICKMDQAGTYSMNSLISCTLHQYNIMISPCTQFTIQEYVFAQKRSPKQFWLIIVFDILHFTKTVNI